MKSDKCPSVMSLESASVKDFENETILGGVELQRSELTRPL